MPPSAFSLSIHSCQPLHTCTTHAPAAYSNVATNTTAIPCTIGAYGPAVFPDCLYISVIFQAHWLWTHCRRGIEKLLRMATTPSAIPATVKGSQLPCAFCKIARFLFTTYSPRTVDIHGLATLLSSQASLLAVFTHWKTVCTLIMLDSTYFAERKFYLQTVHSARLR